MNFQIKNVSLMTLMKNIHPSNNNKIIIINKYILESAGDGGFIVSGLIQSDGDGDLSLFVT